MTAKYPDGRSWHGNEHNRWLRHRRTGTVFDWHPRLAEHPDLEEVTKEQAYPDFFEPKEVVENPPSKKRGRKPNLEVGKIPEEFPPNEELNKDASRPFKNVTGLGDFTGS